MVTDLELVLLLCLVHAARAKCYVVIFLDPRLRLQRGAVARSTLVHLIAAGCRRSIMDPQTSITTFITNGEVESDSITALLVRVNHLICCYVPILLAMPSLLLHVVL